jgi:hypothetical protein
MTTPHQATVLSAILLQKPQREQLLTTKPLPPLSTITYHQLLLHVRLPLQTSQMQEIPSTTPASSTKPTTRPNAPNFASFDHGDHVHIIFCISHSKNCNRTLNKILHFLKATYPGSAEAHTTIQQIRHTQRFLALSYS